MTLPTIVAIGGGSLWAPAETAPIDRFIIAQTNKEQPKVTFIPTASRDNADYIERFEQAYGTLGCTVASVTLTQHDYMQARLADVIGASDVVYVGGGNTLLLYNLCIASGLHTILHDAWQRGTVLAGLSAGCIIWHERGLSDSIQGEWTPIAGLGFVSGFVSPHFDSEPERQIPFRETIARHSYHGLALQDGTAAVYRGSTLTEIITIDEQKHAYRVERTNDGSIQTTTLPQRTL